MHISGRVKGMIMVVIGASLWGLSGNAAQILFQQEQLSTEWLVTIRLLLSGLILLLFAFFSSNRHEIYVIWQNKKTAFQLILFGLLGMLGVQYTYFASIAEGNAAVATILQYLAPLFITVYLLIKFKSPPSKLDIFVLFFATFGTFLLLTNGSLHNFMVSTPAIIWGVLSGLSLAFYTLYSKDLLTLWSSSVLVGWGMIIGGMGMIILQALTTRRFILFSDTPQLHLTTLLLIGFVVLFGTLIAFYLFLDSIRYISPKETTLLGCTEPLAAIISSVIILHTPFLLWQMVGAAIIILVVLVLSLFPQVQEQDV